MIWWSFRNIHLTPTNDLIMSMIDRLKTGKNMEEKVDLDDFVCKEQRRPAIQYLNVGKFTDQINLKKN
jgi:hypothetical protein